MALSAPAALLTVGRMSTPARPLVRAIRRWVRRGRSRITRERLRWSVRVRATVIVVFLAVAVVGRVRGVLPSLVPAVVAAGLGAIMNLRAARRVARWERIPAMLFWTGSWDAVLITYVVVATGGTASPFLFLYVLQVLTTALVVDVGLGATMGVASIVLLSAASAGWRRESAAAALAAVDPADRTLWIASFAVTLVLLVFVGGVLTRRLARSERALAGTHRRLARSLRRLTAAHASLQDAYGKLARAEAELVETDRMKTLQLLVAGLAHELGNPLTVLAGNVEPLVESMRAYERALDACALLADRTSGEDAASARRALAAVATARDETPVLLANCGEATSRATALLAQLRDFGRGGRGTVRRAAPLAPGIVGTLALVRYRLPRGVVVHETYADVPDVVCVPAEINQVLINLMMNAIDALAAGGNLWLGLERDGDDVCILVRDDGAGIDPEVLPHVFEPFVTTKGAGRGTGLGLAISRAIVARHGGRIDVTTGAGKGTTFAVRLPAAGPR